MTHSIVIPHRNRWRNLALCVWSIDHSADVCGIDDYEIIVVNDGPGAPLEDYGGAVQHRIIDAKPRGYLFNKPYCQNIGIEASRGEVVTFLDADAIVAPLWMSCVERLSREPLLTRLCYRVRYLPLRTEESALWRLDRPVILTMWESQYSTLALAHEAYGYPEHNGPAKSSRRGHLIFGNSQFSMRRDVLGTLRYNEAYEGRGWEDLWFIRETWMRDPTAYRAEIVTDGPHALLHVQNALGDPDWHSNIQLERNRRQYQATWNGMKRDCWNQLQAS